MDLQRFMRRWLVVPAVAAALALTGGLPIGADPAPFEPVLEGIPESLHEAEREAFAQIRAAYARRRLRLMESHDRNARFEKQLDTVRLDLELKDASLFDVLDAILNVPC